MGRGGSGGIPQTSLNYTGQRKDGTDLLYYHARSYDPALGRFISADNIGVDINRPQTWNRFTYALNNPLTLTDPTGHCSAHSGDVDERAENQRCTQAASQLAAYDIKVLDLYSEKWLSEQLEWILEGVRNLVSAAGWSILDFQRAMGGTVFLERVLNTPGQVGRFDPPLHAIIFYDAAFKMGKENAKYIVVHELAHVWSRTSKDQLSHGLVARTCAGLPKEACGTLASGVYVPGDYQTGAYNDATWFRSEYEDFADSVAATVYPDQNVYHGPYNPKFRGSSRERYVQEQFYEYGGRLPGHLRGR